MSEYDLKTPKGFFKKYLIDFEGIDLDWVNGSKPKWTSKNLDYFARLGKDYHYKVHAKCQGCEPEYLVDLCWIGEEYNIVLALEQEWARDLQGLEKDFSKLTNVKAYLKVFICHPSRNIPNFPDLIAKHISNIIIKNLEESYLLITFSRNHRTKRIQVDGWSINYRGDTIEFLGQSFFPDSLT